MTDFNLTPVIIKMGKLRSINILKFEDIELAKIFEQGLKTHELILGKKFQQIKLIGLLNNNVEIFCDELNCDTEVFSKDYSNGNNEFVQIADSVSGLNEILEAVKKLWDEKEEEWSLHKSPETMLLRENLLNTIKTNNPNSKVIFWDYHVCAELSLSMS